MIITFISDTHSKHSELKLVSGDILIHCGDFTKKGSSDDIESFLNWFASQDYTYKVFVAGNHDFGFENEKRTKSENLAASLGLIYLNDSEVNIEGLKIWGSPVQPEFFNWAFNRSRGNEIKKHWDLIPSDTDILITHGPPFGILDLCAHGERVGCEELLKKVFEVKPKVHAFGHIHEDYGILEKDHVKFINASNLDEKYQCRNKPITIKVT